MPQESARIALPVRSISFFMGIRADEHVGLIIASSGS